MPFTPGTSVRFKTAFTTFYGFSKKIGVVAGYFDKEEYPDVYSVIITDEFCQETGYGWPWNEQQYEDHPLNDICKDKFVFNVSGSRLISCETKLGNLP